MAQVARRWGLLSSVLASIKIKNQKEKNGRGGVTDPALPGNDGLVTGGGMGTERDASAQVAGRKTTSWRYPSSGLHLGRLLPYDGG